jgi:hypothetical protein
MIPGDERHPAGAVNRKPSDGLAPKLHPMGATAVTHPITARAILESFIGSFSFVAAGCHPDS